MKATLLTLLTEAGCGGGGGGVDPLDLPELRKLGHSTCGAVYVVDT